MNSKILTFFLVGLNWYLCFAATPRRPRVYNALITTDDNLLSSRAYPVIQPTIHETGIAQYPFGPYGFYNTPYVRFGQPITPGLSPKAQLPYPLPQAQFPPQFMRRPLPSNIQPQLLPDQAETRNPPTAPADSQAPNPAQPQPQAPNSPTASQAPENGKQPPQASDGKLPFPQNQYGLPPSLIPLPQYPHPNPNSIHLPPYGFNPINPLGYNPIYGYRDRFLPPYNHLPNHVQQYPVPQQDPKPTTATPVPTEINNETAETDLTGETAETNPSIATTPSFDSINNAANKPKDIPDVPPPPIPAGKPKET